MFYFSLTLLVTIPAI